MYNPNCDGSGPHTGPEVRVLPTGKMSNGIFCRACFSREIAWRIERNKTLGDFAKFDLPTWESLKVCGD